MNRTRRHYDLSDTYNKESNLRRYIRLTVGENASLLALFGHEMLLGLCTGLPGLLGLATRNRLYASFFEGFNTKTFLGRNVTLRCPRQICLGTKIIIDDYVQLFATSRHKDAIVIGSGCSIRSYAMLNAGPPEGYIHIGKDCSIGQATILYGNGGLTIGNKVMIAGQCFIVASSHNYGNPDVPMKDQGYNAEGIIIEDNVWIGAGAKILDGVTIGEGAIIGANSVVNRSIQPRAIVAGVPAREIGDRTNVAAD